MRFRYVPLMFAALAVAGCTSAPSASSYSRNQALQAQNVEKGRIVSMRDVQVEGTKSGVGSGAGAVAGGVAGSFIGGGWRSNVLGAVGGAVLGGIGGSAAEEAITSTTGTEFVVQLDNGRTIAVVQANDANLAPGDRVIVLQGGQTRVVPDGAR
ncbi:putative Outer membrane lipoprotein [uncultured Alphaproteobacteria bacterium]|uniref:Putative Outer membrane lipoprotein n=1 Tax=uncultured Alphaproteobacteria bacterium TaxID=91750 RepID=A0A212J4G4_9PROT|nr:putative Outer membrane lipoprotein [uncultured Alphaproteobacteria bacterium]